MFPIIKSPLGHLFFLDVRVIVCSIFNLVFVASFLPKSIQNLIDEFSRLPGIGPKSAQRLAMYLLHSPDLRLKTLGNAVQNMKEGLQFCKNCWNISENEMCGICLNESRDQEQICVVEEILDVLALEKTLEYKGVYHVLHGTLSPVDGIGPEQIKIQELLHRIETGQNEEGKHYEVILATNPGLEGETTAMYLSRVLKPLGAKVTRIARGLPMGGDLDYADEMTLTKALQGRSDYA